MLSTESKIELEYLKTIAPNTRKLFDIILSALPEHKRFLDLRLSLLTSENISFVEKLSGIIIKIKAAALEDCMSGYQWMCSAVLEEELYFRRNKKYRLTSFKEAVESIYANPVIMKKYMDGLLLSQVLWANHTSVLHYFHENFLAPIPNEFQLLEIGPGHGIFLYFAMCVKNCTRAVGWDISQSSLDFTKNTLESLTSLTKLELSKQDIFSYSTDEKFDVIVLSEILEHLENPRDALLSIKPLLAKGGRLFINVPCNSPAPDHIYLFRHPNEVFELLSDCGYRVQSSVVFPATGVALQKALEKCLTTSIVAIATI